MINCNWRECNWYLSSFSFFRKREVWFGFRFWPFIGIQINPPIKFTLGASYDFFKYQTTDLSSYYYINSTPVLISKTDVFRYSLLSISSKLKIKIGNRKLYFGIVPGLNFSILASNSYKSDLPFSEKTRLFKNGDCFISGSFGLVINYRISNTFILYFESDYTQSFTPLVYHWRSSYQNDTSNNYLRYVKNNIGIRYHF